MDNFIKEILMHEGQGGTSMERSEPFKLRRVSYDREHCSVSSSLFGLEKVQAEDVVQLFNYSIYAWLRSRRVEGRGGGGGSCSRRTRCPCAREPTSARGQRKIFRGFVCRCRIDGR